MKLSAILFAASSAFALVAPANEKREVSSDSIEGVDSNIGSDSIEKRDLEESDTQDLEKRHFGPRRFDDRYYFNHRRKCYWDNYRGFWDGPDCDDFDWGYGRWGRQRWGRFGRSRFGHHGSFGGGHRTGGHH